MDCLFIALVSKSTIILKNGFLFIKVRLHALGGVLGHYKIPIFIQNSLEVCDPVTYDLYFAAVFSPAGLNKSQCPAKKVKKKKILTDQNAK